MTTRVFGTILMVIGFGVAAKQARCCPPPCYPPYAFDLSSPKGGVCQSETGVTLDWGPSTYASKYYVYLGTDSNPAVYLNKWTVYDTFKVLPTSLDPATTYYWWVQAVNSCNVTNSSTRPASFKTEPGAAFNEDPVDEDEDISRDVDLSWTGGTGTGLHCVYFGTSAGAVADATTNSDEFMSCQAPNSYDLPGTLNSNTPYYWRIDEVDDGCVRKGCVWEFTTCAVANQASPLAPQDGTTGVDTDANLVWSVDGGALLHDVYFGTDSDAVTNATTASPQFKASQSETIYYLPTMACDTQYYWRIDEKNDCDITTGEVWDFRTCDVPGQAYGAYPGPNSTGVQLDVVLSWTPSAGAQDPNGHDVYFGTDFNDVNEAQISDANIYVGELDSNSYDPGGLGDATTYYWRIDEVNDCGTGKGMVWHFTTCSLPGEANEPEPEPNEVGVDLDANLSWTAGLGTTEHDVYFGTDFGDVNGASDANVLPGRGRQDSNGYDLGVLDANVTYYWRIDEKSGCCITKGAVWQFTSCAACGKATDPAAMGPLGEPNTVDSVLSWRSGLLAESHIIYFGVDYNRVGDANISSDEFMGIQDGNSFDTARKFGFLFARSKMRSVGSLTRAPQPNVIYVDAQAKGGNDGTGWSDAYTDLQDGLSDASGSGKDIWVAEGTYRPTDGNDRTASFELVSGVAVYGGFSGTEVAVDERDWRKFETILSGDINTIGELSDNCYHVVTGSGTDADTVLDGFTIIGGNADGSSTAGYGGGMYNSGASPLVVNCKFCANKAVYGGAIANSNSSSPTIQNCIFSKNQAAGGGAVYTSGGGPTVTSCLFYENEATNSGGALCNFGTSVEVTNCVFSRNLATGGSGGGAILNHLMGSPKITNCTFNQNSATTSSGGAMANHYSTTPVILNCIFWGNDANVCGGELYNKFDSAEPNFKHCDIEGGLNGSKCCGPDSVDGGGNTDGDPGFVDAEEPYGLDGIFGTLDDGLRISAESNCVDAGEANTSASDAGTVDAAGCGRFVDGDGNSTEVIDLGAYEYGAEPEPPQRYSRPLWTEALGINDSGRIVGVSYDPNGKAHALSNVPSEGNEPEPWVSPLSDLHYAGDANESAAYAISDSNWLVGKLGAQAFCMNEPDAPNMVELGGLFSETDHESVAYAIGDGSGGLGPAAVGSSGGHAVLWDELDSNEPVIYDLGTVVRYHKSKAYGINQFRQVVGCYWPAFGDEPHERAFIGSAEHGLSDLGTLGQGSVSRAYGINELGQVVGAATLDVNNSLVRGFIYDGGQMQDLNELVLGGPNDANWVVLSARSINDNGLIAGYGKTDDSDRYTRALLLLPARCVGYWRFDEGGGTMTMDSSVFGNHGRLYGPAWTAGKMRGALNFDGDDGVYIEESAGEDSVLNIYESDVTVSAWVRPGAAGGTIVARAKPGHVAYRLGVEANKVYVNTCRLEDWIMCTDAILKPGAWCHVVGVFDRGKKRACIYVDGIKRADGPMTIACASNDATTKIGCRNDASDDGFDGIIDDVRIYPWALNEGEAGELFEGGNW